MLYNLIKPIGAFIEYTIKPLIDETRELVEIMERNGWKPNELKKSVIKIVVFQSLLGFIQAILITGIICYTCLHIKM